MHVRCAGFVYRTGRDALSDFTRSDFLKLSWPGLIVLAAALLFFVIGYLRGFIKEIISVVFIFLAIAIVAFINPHVNRFIKENTPVYSSIEKTCTNYITEQIGQAGDKAALSVNQQMGILKDLSLPDVVKNLIQKNNTAEIYEKLEVSTFAEYISAYLANLITNCISFLVSFILVTLLLRTASFILNIFARLPVINGVNRLLGGLLGVGKLLIFIWIAMIAATILCKTEPGKMLLDMINADKILSWIYQNNLIAKYFHLV